MIVVLAGLIANIWRPSLLYGLGASSDYLADVLLILTLISLFEFIVVWLVLTAVMSFVTGYLGGELSFGRFLRLSGYGFIPLIVSGAIWSIGHYLTYTSVGAPDPPISDGFYYQYDAYVSFLELGSGALLYGSIAVGSLFVLASGYLWFQAISATTELERDKAIIPVAIAMALTFVWVFLTMV